MVLYPLAEHDVKLCKHQMQVLYGPVPQYL